MSYRLFHCSALIVAGVLSACSLQSTQKHSDTIENKIDFATYDAETFYDTTQFVGASFSADNQKILIGSDETGVINLFAVDVASGHRQQLTFASETTYPLGYFPEDDRTLMMSDSGGNERPHIYVREPQGKTTDLTPGDKVRARFKGFSQDKKSFYILSNQRDERYMDLYRYNAQTYESELIYQNDQGISVSRISPNGRYLALRRKNSNKDIDLLLLDLEDKSRSLLDISNAQESTSVEALSFSADSQSIYYSTDGKGEFTQAWRYHLQKKSHELVIESDWDVRFVYFSKSGRYRVSGINADASTQVTIVDTDTQKILPLPSLPAGNISSVRFSQDESHLLFYLSSDTSPKDLFVWPIGDVKAKQLTHSLSKKIDSTNLVESQVVHFKSFDGLEIPGILYKPKQASAQQPVPAMIWVHGGPGGQSRRGYNAGMQHLINHGYAIFAVNNRGSSGYGKTFYHLDDKKHGQDDLQDIIYGKKYLQNLSWVKADKIGVMGGSYGGYLTAAALAFAPEVFEVGIDIFGVTNWVRTLNSIPPWWESYKKGLYDEMGDPATDGERHKAISPLFHADNIVKPLMVIQGANDPRVLQVESDEMVEAVKKNDVPVRYVLFPDEGHGFKKRKNRITASQAYLEFLQEYL